MKLHEYDIVEDMCGGAAIAHLARQGDEQRYQLMTSQYSAKIKDCSFSFSGILSHAQRLIAKNNIQYSNTSERSRTDTAFDHC
jgi:tRNA A37 threonylcarbamoyltransferase TsaD